MSCRFREAGPISCNPLQAAEQRSCGYVRHLHLNIVPRRGTDASRMMFRMIVGPALRNQGMVMSAYPTAALLRSLQWVSDGYVSHRDTVLIGVSAMGGCVATAGRHSLLSLPRQLVNYSLFS